MLQFASTEGLIFAILLVVALVSLAKKINPSFCHICGCEITKKTKYEIWDFDGEEHKLCMKCSRKLDNKQHKERFDNFFQDDFVYHEPQNNRYITAQTKKAVWQRDSGRCVNCGSNQKLEYDHIIPLSKGGSNTARNIQLLCEECNRKKSNKIQ